jgi:hypothetical protein
LGIGLVGQADCDSGSATSQPRARSGAAARDLTGNGLASDSYPDDEPFRVFLLACLNFAGRIRVKKKTSVPRPRLACVHLQTSYELFLSSLIGCC